MLRFLSIKHLAVIDAVEVEFAPGFNVLTGETGTGKSILVGAVGLLLGGRASGDLVRTGEESATVEAIFETAGSELLVRRDVTAQGRSRAFIDGQLVTAGALKELAGGAIELHGQHEHHTLLDPSAHVAVLDAFGNLSDESSEVAAAFEAMQSSAEELNRAREATEERTARQELLAFQLSELDRAALIPAEDEELKASRYVLANAERVERLCAESYAALYESEHAVLAQLGSVWRRVGDLASFDASFQLHLDARDAIKSQLEDLAEALRRYASSINTSPEQLQKVEERLALLERLKRKYGPTLDDVIARRDRWRAELNDMGNLDERTQALADTYEGARTGFGTAARALSAARRRVAVDFARRLERLLADLAMGGTRFDVRFNSEPLAESKWSAQGIDALEFFVSPNPGEELRPLARIVSGGELSRIMLAIKTLSASNRQGFTEADDRPPSGAAPGLIFDEVDAGIGGRAADVVGRKLRALASTSQVLCITHLPQIAAYADTHFAIDKRVEHGRTHTSVTRLNEQRRVEELARMMGGESITDRLRASAREMLDRRKSAAGSGESEPISKGESESVRPAKGEGGSGRRSTATTRIMKRPES
ncbi:MAG: DNA repair protein RecN [Blastocatellia bacterium]|nr:MAG: DNA repair protein RecN [Blastocatellia bacterium]